MSRKADEIAARIGALVKKRRKEAGYSLSELSARSGIARGTIHSIENGGVRRVAYATLERLADALTLPPDALLGRDLSRVNLTDEEQRMLAAMRRIWPERAP